MDDRQIIELYNQRDENAIKETSDKYRNYCFSIANNILDCKQDSEECINDTWLQTWNSIPPQKPNCLKAFLAKITRNLSLNRYKEKTRDKRGNGEVVLALDEMEEVRVNMLALEYDRFKGYTDENTMQKQMQTYRALEAKAADLDQEKLNEKRMSIRPQKEETAKKRISDLYGYCQDNLFRASKNAVAKRLGEQPSDIEKQEPNKQTVPTQSWLRGRKKNDDREER